MERTIPCNNLMDYEMIRMGIDYIKGAIILAFNAHLETIDIKGKQYCSWVDYEGKRVFAYFRGIEGEEEAVHMTARRLLAIE